MADVPNYGDIYEAAGRQWGVDPRLLKSVAQKESEEGRNPASRYPNASGARGVMQFIPSTAATYNVDVNDPWSSIYGAAHYLRDLLDQNKGNLDVALSHYGNDMDGHKGYAPSVRQIYDPLVAAQQNQQPAGQPSAPSDQPAAPNIVDMTKQAGFGNKFGDLQPVQGMIIHHTGGGSDVGGVISTFHQTGFPAQYVIGKDGTIYQTIPDGAQGRQIQTGTGLGKGLSNANTIGVEIIAKDNNDVSPAQIAAGQQLTNFLGQKYNFNPYTQVYGHGEVNPGHKEPDEGQGTTYAQRYAMGTGPQPPAPGTVPPQTLPPLPPGQPDYRGGLPPTVGLDSKGNPVNLPTIAFDSQGVPYNPYTVGAHGTPAGVSIPAQPSPGVEVEKVPLPGDDDFSHLTTSASAAPAPQQGASPTMATKAADDDFSHLITPQQAEALAPAVADPEIYPTPIYMPPSATAGGPAPSWLERNITNPLTAAWNPVPAAQQPSQNYLLGSPLLQGVVAAPLQGIRDEAQTLTGWVRDADKNYPWLASVDQAARNVLPSWFPLVGGANPATTNRDLAAESTANQVQYGSSIPFALGRAAGNIAAVGASTPGLGPLTRAVGGVARMVPGVGRILGGAGEGALTAGVQNALTSPDQDPREAFMTGAKGGALVGGALGVGGALTGAGRAPNPAMQNIADNLEIDLSRGQQYGGMAKRIEDTTAPFPGSGAEQFAQRQRQQIAGVIAREAGMPEGTEHITTPLLNETERRIGNDIEGAAANITVPGTPLLNSLAPIEQAAVQAGANTPQAATFRNLSDQLLNLTSNNGGVLPGNQFQRFIARGGPLDVARGSSVPEVRAVGNQIREALLDAAQQGTPATQDALQQLQAARQQWRVVQTVRPAIDRTVTGTEEMSLPALANAIRSEYGARQGGNLFDLSQLISGPLRTLPSSGTAERNLWQRFFMGDVGALPFVGGVATGIPAAIAGRLSRFGPNMGSPYVQAVREAYNPIMPRMVGPALGQNWLANQQPQTP